MKGLKHIKRFNESEENLNISDVMNSTFMEFRNNVFCRRETNQYKAKKLWKEISVIMDNVIKHYFKRNGHTI
jgi:hypothetical protein